MSRQMLSMPSAPGCRDGEGTGWDEAPRIRLLLVDDDDLFREVLANNLVEEGFEVVACGNGKDCLDTLYLDQRFDLILLDWRMPGMSGIEVLQEIKAADITVPVVFLTALATERNEETAFDCGAIDFLDKSRSGAVLGRRVRLLVAGGRASAAEAAGGPDSLRLGSLEIHFRVSRANWNGRLVPLTTTEFRVVQLLASRAGEDVSYRAIYDVVHGRGFIAGDGSHGYRTNVRSLIRRIRQKFRDVSTDFDEIENYPGFGYRWRLVEERQAGAGQGDAMADAFAASFTFAGFAGDRQRVTSGSGDSGAGRAVPRANGTTLGTARPDGEEREPQGDHRPGDGDTT